MWFQFRTAMVCLSGVMPLTTPKNQMKFFNAIAAAAVIGGSLISTATPASAQYYSGNYGTSTYTVRPRANGFQVRDNYGNYTNYTNRAGGGYNYRNSNGGYGQIPFNCYSVGKPDAALAECG